MFRMIPKRSGYLVSREDADETHYYFALIFAVSSRQRETILPRIIEKVYWNDRIVLVPTILST